MQERTSVIVFEERVKRTVKAFRRKHGRRPKGHMKIFPRCFSEGSAEKSHCTASVRNDGWHPGLEPVLPEESIDKWDRSRSLLPKSAKADWYYLIEHNLDNGELLVTSRGKEMVIACGYHAALIHFGFEACIIKISQTDLNDILSQDIPGPSEDSRKAQRLRSFVVPSRLVEDYSSSTQDRHMNIFLAVLLENGDAFILTDFSRIVRMTFISKDRHWNEADFEVKSPSWLSLWGYGRGPCWQVESDDAFSALDNWRSEVLDGSVSRQSQRIVDAISNDNFHFNGLGAHMANDALHSIGIHPLAPLWYICDDDELFTQFKIGLQSYCDILLCEKFVHRVASNANSSNPLAYNKESARVFIQSFVKVYRKQPAYLPFDHWRSMYSRGLFDPNHTIGSPYVPNFATHKEHKKMDIFVLQNESPKFKCYTCILAKIPEEWNRGTFLTSLSEHIDLAGYKTTLGAAECLDQKKNMLNLGTYSVTAGRRPFIKTGKPGRPAKKPKIGNVRKKKEELERKKARTSIPFQPIVHDDAVLDDSLDHAGAEGSVGSKRKRNPNPRYIT